MKTFPLNIAAATLSEYKMVTPNLAKVTVSFQEGASRQDIAASLTHALNGAGSAVEGSFRAVGKTSAIGFVSASKETRPVDTPAEIARNYRILAGNMYLDNKDKSLWELKEGASGKYLARNGVDNLESLIQASRVSPTGSMPRLSRIVSAQVTKHEFVAFIKQSDWSTDVSYGFCLANTGDSLTIVTEDSKETVSADRVVASYTFEDKKPKNVKSSVFDQPINTMKEYYKLAYGGQDGSAGDQAQQDYVAAIIDQIDQMALV